MDLPMKESGVNTSANASGNESQRKNDPDAKTAQPLPSQPGKTTILQHLQSIQLSDSSDEEGLSMLQNTTQHTASRATTSAANDANASVVRLEWDLILSNPEHAWR